MPRFCAGKFVFCRALAHENLFFAALQKLYLHFSMQAVIIISTESTAMRLIRAAMAAQFRKSASAGVLELADEADSKSVGLITRAGSTPATGTITGHQF